MKKLQKNKLFLAIAGGLVLILIAISLFLEAKGIITIPQIDNVRLYRHIKFSLGAPEYFNLPCSYSRLWDISLLPIFIGLLLWSWKRAAKEANLWMLFSEALLILALAYSLTSNMIAISSVCLFALLCGLAFGERTALFVSVIAGLVVGMVSFGLLIGLIIAIVCYVFFLGTRFLL